MNGNTSSAAEALRSVSAQETVSPATTQLIRDIGAASSSGALGVSPHVVFSSLAEGASGATHLLYTVLAVLTRFGGPIVPLVILALGFYQARQTAAGGLTKALNALSGIAKFFAARTFPGASLAASAASWLGSKFSKDEMDAYDDLLDPAMLQQVLGITQAHLPIPFQLLLGNSATEGAAAAPVRTTPPAGEATTASTSTNPWINLFNSFVGPALSSDALDSLDDGRVMAARVAQAAIDCGVDPQALQTALSNQTPASAQDAEDYATGAAR